MKVFSNPPNLYDGNKPNKNIYRDGNKIKTGYVPVTTGYRGYIPDNEYDLNANSDMATTFNISYTLWGDKGEIILLEPGVPSNKEAEYIEIQRRLSPFFRTVSIDMLGMGMSDKPLNYENNWLDKRGHEKTPDTEPWDWVNDIDYVDTVMNTLFPDEKFTYLASDWAGGISVTYAAKYNHRLNALILLDPIAFDGYPVNEIQAIGRASILNNEQFTMAMGAADQTLVQIFKTMVQNPDKVWNQYTLRTIMKTYIDVDYERNKDIEGTNATSMTMKLKLNNLRVLADRSAILSPSLLLPIEENKKGVQYKNITVPTLVIWGAQDSMMPSNQAYRYLWAMPNSNVEIQMVEDAGHFVELDQPERVSEIIINFIARELGRDKLADIFLGYTGIWKGDEYDLINGLRRMYGKDI